MKIGIDAVDNSRLHDACCWKEFSDTTQHSRLFLFYFLVGLFHAILITIVQEPNTLRPRGFRLCEPFGSYQVKMKESELKIRSHRPIVH